MKKSALHIAVGTMIVAVMALNVWTCRTKDQQKPSASNSIHKTSDGEKSTKSHVSLAGPQKEEPTWEATCSTEGITFKIIFRSPSEDVTSDDMTTAIHWSDGKATPIPLKPGWFMPDVEITSDIQNKCKRIFGNELPNGRVLLWIVRNDRPNADKIALILLDISAKKILDIQDEVGELANNPIIVRREIGSSILLSRDSRQSNEGGEFGIPEWMDVIVVHDRISLRWHR
jgi:hypothetical protein